MSEHGTHSLPEEFWTNGKRNEEEYKKFKKVKKLKDIRHIQNKLDKAEYNRNQSHKTGR